VTEEIYERPQDYLHTGFEMERIYGDYRFGPLRATSQQLIAIGQRPA
jgi:hypothetical protein